MKMLSLLLLLVPFVSEAATDVIRLAADRASYASGEKAVLRAVLASKPDNSTMEFDVEGKLNNALLPISRITDFEFFSVTEPLAAGTYTWSAVVYLQDARLARDLKASIIFFTGEISKIDAALAVELDPDKIAQLQAAKIRYQNLKSSSQAQLSSIRTQVYGPVTTSIQVF